MITQWVTNITHGNPLLASIYWPQRLY